MQRAATRTRGRYLAAALAIAVGLTAVPAAEWSRPHQLLKERLGISETDFATLERGRPVVRPLASDGRDIAMGGAVRIDVPAEFFLSRFVDIVAFKRGAIVKQIGKFSDSPNVDDLADLSLDQADLEALKDCRVQSCAIHLTPEQIRRVKTEIPWKAADARERANTLMRELIVESVRRYLVAGNSALPDYRDGRDVRAGQEVESLVARSASLLINAPEFGEYLSASSAAAPEPLPRTEQFVYWSKEQFGLKPVISVTHVVLYRPRRPEAPDVLIASKQLYASRYFAGSLALTLAIQSGASQPSSFYMVYSNRTRPVSFPPIIGGLIRRRAQSESRSALELNLRLMKDRLEREFRETASAGDDLPPTFSLK